MAAPNPIPATVEDFFRNGLHLHLVTPNTAGTECSICREPYQSTDGDISTELPGGATCAVIRVCNHIYHYDCIYTWVVDFKSNTCPYCRTILYLKEEEGAADEEGEIFTEEDRAALLRAVDIIATSVSNDGGRAELPRVMALLYLVEDHNDIMRDSEDPALVQGWVDLEHRVYELHTHSVFHPPREPLEGHVLQDVALDEAPSDYSSEMRVQEWLEHYRDMVSWGREELEH